MVKKYPRKSSVRKVIKEHQSALDTKLFLAKRGIFAFARAKKDLAKIGGDYYFNQKDFKEFKSLMEIEQNLKKSARFTFPKNLKKDLEDAFISLNNRVIDIEDNTKIKVSKNKGNLNVLLTYDEYKPSMIDLLDKTSKQVELSINEHSTECSLDYDLQSSQDHKKVKELLQFIGSNVKDITFSFSEITLAKLPKEQRIELFSEFFKTVEKPWELVEINKLKVKRYEDEKNVSEDQLHGINSALLDGSNLSENQFVKDTIEKGFYFSMISLRLDKKETPNFMDLVIDFKSRPEMCEVKVSNSGVYAVPESGAGTTEIKRAMNPDEQDRLLMLHKNNLSKIYSELLETSLPTLDATLEETAATIEEK